MSEKESKELLQRLNVSKSQLPKIYASDPALPEGCNSGDIIKIERKDGDKSFFYFRVVI
jgi:DNA-directed RNA polymerase subunit H (RpoH/RPB5)